MCPFIVGPLCLTVVCVDIGVVGDVEVGSVYGKIKKQLSIFSFIFLVKVLNIISSFRVKWEDGRGKRD